MGIMVVCTILHFLFVYFWHNDNIKHRLHPMKPKFYLFQVWWITWFFLLGIRLLQRKYQYLVIWCYYYFIWTEMQFVMMHFVQVDWHPQSRIYVSRTCVGYKTDERNFLSFSLRMMNLSFVASANILWQHYYH